MEKPTEDLSYQDNPLFKLDIVLMFLFIHDSYLYTLDEIHMGVSTQIKSDDNEIGLILKKLDKDGYVITHAGDKFDINTKSTAYVNQFCITFDGKIFLKQGGYNLEDIRFREQNKRLEKLEIDQRENQRNMEKLTFWIAVGAIVASGYYIYYLIIPIYDHFFLKK